MALVSMKYNYIYFHLFKCAGNSIRKVLKITRGTELHGVHVEAKDVKKHFEARGIIKQYEDYFKFAFIRNPYNWMISTYFYIKASRIHYEHQRANTMNFQQFLDYYIKVMMTKPYPYGSNKCITLNEFVRDEEGKIIVDYIGKVETLEKDFRAICEKIDFKYYNKETHTLPFINVTGNRDKGYRQYYNAASKKMVADRFAEDLDYFKYTF